MSKHPIVHVEFSVADRSAYAQFLSDLFGWEIQHFPESEYATFSTGPDEVGGGVGQASGEFPVGTVLVYVNTDNINETLEKAVALGATVVQPRREIPGIGYFAIFKDPTGSTLALLEPVMQQ